MEKNLISYMRNMRAKEGEEKQLKLEIYGQKLFRLR